VAGVVGHREPVRDALQHLDGGDLAPGDDPADVALLQSDGGAELGLTCSSFLCHQPEQAADVTTAQHLPQIIAGPQARRNVQRVERHSRLPHPS
jgi:hypothetical protein